MASLPRVVSTIVEIGRVGRDVDGQRVDVEAAPGEETDDARQLAEAVLDQNRENVALFHARSRGSGGSLSASGCHHDFVVRGARRDHRIDVLFFGHDDVHHDDARA